MTVEQRMEHFTEAEALELAAMVVPVSRSLRGAVFRAVGRDGGQPVDVPVIQLHHASCPVVLVPR